MIFGSHIVVFSSDAHADRAFMADVLGLDHVDGGGGWLIFALPPAESPSIQRDCRAEAVLHVRTTSRPNANTCRERRPVFRSQGASLGISDQDPTSRRRLRLVGTDPRRGDGGTDLAPAVVSRRVVRSGRSRRTRLTDGAWHHPAYDPSMGIEGNRSTDRTLTTHVGSLIRPDDLVAALQARRASGSLGGDDAEFDELLSRSVEEIVRRQAAIGIDVVSDGEFGKTISWSRYILERLDGFEDRPVPAAPRERRRDRSVRAPISKSSPSSTPNTTRPRASKK